MASFQRERTRPLAEINVVPYIDVMLVLLVIFMITAPLLTQGVHVNLPRAEAKAIDKQQEPIIVSVDSQGHFFLNVSPHPGEAIEGQELMTDVAARLTLAREKHQPQEVYVKGDTAVSYGKVMAAMVMLQKAGAENVGLITQPPE